MLADKLNMTPDDAERWIVNLIRNARLDAKIDSKLVRGGGGGGGCSSCVTREGCGGIISVIESKDLVTVTSHEAARLDAIGC